MMFTKEQLDLKVMEAVAGARKAWAKQGCPEVKALHAAEAIRDLADQFSSSPSLYTNSSEVRDCLLKYADNLERIADQQPNT